MPCQLSWGQRFFWLPGNVEPKAWHCQDLSQAGSMDSCPAPAYTLGVRTSRGMTGTRGSPVAAASVTGPGLRRAGVPPSGFVEATPAPPIRGSDGFKALGVFRLTPNHKVSVVRAPLSSTGRELRQGAVILGLEGLVPGPPSLQTL